MQLTSINNMKLKKVSKIMMSEQDKTVDWCVKGGGGFNGLACSYSKSNLCKDTRAAHLWTICLKHSFIDSSIFHFKLAFGTLQIRNLSLISVSREIFAHIKRKELKLFAGEPILQITDPFIQFISCFMQNMH